MATDEESQDLVVTQLKQGIWLVDWFVDCSLCEQISQLNQTTLKLTSNIVDGIVTLSLSLNKGKACDTFQFLLKLSSLNLKTNSVNRGPNCRSSGFVNGSS